MAELEKVAPSSRLRMQKDEADYESDTEVCTIIKVFTGHEYNHDCFLCALVLYL